MSRRRVTIGALVAAVAAVVIVGALLGRDTGPATAVPSSEDAGRVAFEGDDIFTGDKIGLSRFERKPVVVTIWASWCPGCNAEA